MNVKLIFLFTCTAVQYLQGISKELFTAKSRGGVVLLFVYFYVIFIFSLVFFVEEQVFSPSSSCVLVYDENQF